jgi:hypothetical protein
METPAAPERLWPRYVRIVEALVLGFSLLLFEVVLGGSQQRLIIGVCLGSAPAFLWLAHSP